MNTIPLNRSQRRAMRYSNSPAATQIRKDAEGKVVVKATPNPKGWDESATGPTD